MARLSADVRRDLLVQAAIRVMVRDGVAQTTTRSIVAEAGMNLGAFHYCFRSKEELLEQVIAAISNRPLEKAIAIIEGEGELAEKLRGAIGVYWDDVIANPGDHRVTYELTQHAVHTPALEELARRQYQTYLGSVGQVMDALADSCAVTWMVPVPVLARYLTGVVDGLTLLYLNEGDAEAAGAAVQLAADHVATLAVPAAT